MRQNHHNGFDGSNSRVKEAYYAPKPFRRTKQSREDTSRPSQTGRWIAGALIAIASFGAGYYFATRPTLTGHIDEVTVAGSRAFNMPATGVIAKAQVPKAAVVAPLKLTGATDTDCLFELRRWDGGGAPLLRALVRSRESVETSIPLGKYAGTIKCGSSWYGATEFGANSSVDRITTPLEFVRSENGKVQGMMIELTRRAGGNLPALRF